MTCSCCKLYSVFAALFLSPHIVDDHATCTRYYNIVFVSITLLTVEWVDCPNFDPCYVCVLRCLWHPTPSRANFYYTDWLILDRGIRCLIFAVTNSKFILSGEWGVSWIGTYAHVRKVTGQILLQSTALIAGLLIAGLWIVIHVRLIVGVS